MSSKESAVWSFHTKWDNVSFGQMLYVHAVIMPEIHEVIEKHKECMNELGGIEE